MAAAKPRVLMASAAHSHENLLLLHHSTPVRSCSSARSLCASSLSAPTAPKSLPEAQFLPTVAPDPVSPQSRMERLAAKEQECETMVTSLKVKEAALLHREQLFVDFIRARLENAGPSHLGPMSTSSAPASPLPCRPPVSAPEANSTGSAPLPHPNQAQPLPFAGSRQEGITHSFSRLSLEEGSPCSTGGNYLLLAPMSLCGTLIRHLILRGPPVGRQQSTPPPPPL